MLTPTHWELVNHCTFQPRHVASQVHEAQGGESMPMQVRCVSRRPFFVFVKLPWGDLLLATVPSRSCPLQR